MSENDIYSNWSSNIDLAKTRTAKSPPFIFLCGGKISSDSQCFSSCRHVFYQYIQDNNIDFKEKIVLAEDVFKYFENSDYEDLLNFERDLAELSSLTVLFTESPGSIAELGSFVVLEGIQERLLVVVNENHSFNESFIWRGPILYLKNIAKNKSKIDPVSIYHWEDDDSGNKFEHAEDLVELIYNVLRDIPRSERIRKESIGHIMFLITGILQVVRISTLDEMRLLLNKLGFKYGNNDKVLRQYISLLISSNLIKRVPYRNNVYYVPIRNEDWIRWGYIDDAKNKDIDRWRNLFTRYYEENQKEKHRALASYLKSSNLIG